MDIRPFHAIRPTRDKAYLVATRSYVSYSEEMLRDKLLNNPYTFLQIIHPDRYGEPQSHGMERFRKVRERFDEFADRGIFLEESAPAFYVYSQVHADRSHTGVIAAVAIQDYLNGHIKVHEHTLHEREEMFRDYLEVTGFNAEPVLLSHPRNQRIVELVQQCSQERAEYEFTSTDGILHLMWPVSDANFVRELTEAYAALPDLYIADGHHRTASSALLHQSVPNKSNAYFMAMLMDESEMHFSAFSRMVRHSYRSLAAVKKAIQTHFEVEETMGPRDLQGAEMQLYGEGKWFNLRLKADVEIPHDPVGRLNPSLVAKYILNEVFDIFDQRRDERLAFLPDTDHGHSLQQAIDSGKYEFGIRMGSLSGKDVRAVADAGEVMPPKSTYIEPKLRSGLLIYSLRDE